MGTIIHQPAAQMMAGHAIGILLLNTGYPIIPGNVANASTYNYPVRFKVVEGADSPRLIGGDPTLLEPILAAARELVRDGCRAIVGACGYFARFQRELAEALPVPVFLSSLCQVPMVLGALQPQQQLGILCAKAEQSRPADADGGGYTRGRADRCGRHGEQPRVPRRDPRRPGLDGPRPGAETRSSALPCGW